MHGKLAGTGGGMSRHLRRVCVPCRPGIARQPTHTRWGAELMLV